MKALEQWIGREPSAEGPRVKAHGNSDMIKLNAEGQYVKALEGLKCRGTICEGICAEGLV